jgi:hypothetical protein
VTYLGAELSNGSSPAALNTAIPLDDGRPGYTTGKDLNSPGRADEICCETAMWLVTIESGVLCDLKWTGAQPREIPLGR